MPEEQRNKIIKLEDMLLSHKMIQKRWLEKMDCDFYDIRSKMILHLQEEVVEVFAETNYYKNYYSESEAKINYEALIEEYVDLLNITMHFMNAYRIKDIPGFYANVYGVDRDIIPLEQLHWDIKCTVHYMEKIIRNDFSKAYEFGIMRGQVNKLINLVMSLGYALDIDRTTIEEVYSDKLPLIKLKLL